LLLLQVAPSVRRRGMMNYWRPGMGHDNALAGSSGIEDELRGCGGSKRRQLLIGGWMEVCCHSGGGSGWRCHYHGWRRRQLRVLHTVILRGMNELMCCCCNVRRRKRQWKWEG